MLIDSSDVFHDENHGTLDVVFDLSVLGRPWNVEISQWVPLLDLCNSVDFLKLFGLDKGMMDQPDERLKK